jgi:hypothetical protein
LKSTYVDHTTLPLSTQSSSSDTREMLKLQRRMRASPGQLRRLQHSAAAASASSSSSSSSGKSAGADSSSNGEEPPKYKPGWFSRNPGVTLGGILLGIGCYIYRGSRGKKNFEALQNPIAESAVISPYEAWELRSSNNITYGSIDCSVGAFWGSNFSYKRGLTLSDVG